MQPPESSGQRLGDTAEGDIENLRDLTVLKAFGAEIETVAILCGHCVEHRKQTLLTLPEHNLLFGRGSGIVPHFRKPCTNIRHRRLRTVGQAFFQAKVVGHAKNPATNILLRFAGAQMLEQR